MKNLFLACIAVIGMLFSTEAAAQTVFIANSSSCNYMVRVYSNGCIGQPLNVTQFVIGPLGAITVPYVGMLESIVVTDVNGNTSVSSNLCFLPLNTTQLGTGGFSCPSGTTLYGNILNRYSFNYYELEIAE